MSSSIELHNLSIGYPAKSGHKLIASQLNGSIHPGELTCLLGPNGVGKSTLLRTLSAFQPALDGHILIMDRPLASLSNRAISRTIGLVLTEKPDVQHMTVEELVSMGRSPYTGFWGRPTDEDRAIVHESMQLIGISQLAHRRVSTLSDGERQKAMTAKALAQQTPVIFLDEPTAFLDYPSKVELMQLLRRLARETQKIIFMSTHDVELALQLADTLWLMQPGGTLSIGTPRQLSDDGTLSAFIERPGIVYNKENMTITASL